MRENKTSEEKNKRQLFTNQSAGTLNACVKVKITQYFMLIQLWI